MGLRPLGRSSSVVALLSACTAVAALYVAGFAPSGVVTQPWHVIEPGGVKSAIEVISRDATPSGRVVPAIVAMVLAQTSLVAWVVARRAKRRREPQPGRPQ